MPKTMPTPTDAELEAEARQLMADRDPGSVTNGYTTAALLRQLDEARLADPGHERQPRTDEQHLVIVALLRKLGDRVKLSPEDLYAAHLLAATGLPVVRTFRRDSDRHVIVELVA